MIAAAAAPTLTITTSALPAPTSANYVAVLAATGGDQPYIWSLINDNGSGLTLSTSGVLSGTSPAPGAYSLAVAVSSDDGQTAQKSLSLNVPAP